MKIIPELLQFLKLYFLSFRSMSILLHILMFKRRFFSPPVNIIFLFLHTCELAWESNAASFSLSLRYLLYKFAPNISVQMLSPMQ